MEYEEDLSGEGGLSQYIYIYIWTRALSLLSLSAFSMKFT